MYNKTIECLYANAESRVQKFADLKEMYAMTRSQNIKKLLKVSENFVLFGCGSLDNIMRIIDQVESPTDEEKLFFFNLQEALS